MAGLARRRLLGVALAAVSGLVLVTPGAASASTTLSLPRPTGPYAVGATDLYLKDTSRPDPWVSTEDARELMVTVWYPTDARTGRPMPYMSAEESRLFLAGKRLTDLPADTLSTVRTNAFADARPVGRAHSRPLIVLSPGYTTPRATLTGLAEDLASHGYVVVGIDHTYETYAVTFPDGRIATCVTCGLVEDDAFFHKLYQVHAADVSFVIDRLTGPHPAWRGSWLIDARHIGMAGHSSGGASAIAAMRGDPRIDAGIDMDGTTRDQIPPGGLAKPFMLLGTSIHSPGGPDTSWDHDFSRMTGWRRWLVVAGTVHTSFTDLAVFSDQLGLDIGATIAGDRALQITRRYVRAMFDRHLRQRPEPLLDDPSASYPEVTIAAR